jgi:SAM-dependent methyltransferase
MDARVLRFPDDTFDGISGSSAIEHYDNWLDVAHAVYEMGRVLKPAGILSLRLNLLLAGPPGGRGLESWFPLSVEDIDRFVVGASGLEPTGELRSSVSTATLETPRDLVAAIREHGGPVRRATDAASGHWMSGPFPHLLDVREGYVFGSVHLALRKSESYPTTSNEWANPSDEVLRLIRRENKGILEALRS